MFLRKRNKGDRDQTRIKYRIQISKFKKSSKVQISKKEKGSRGINLVEPGLKKE